MPVKRKNSIKRAAILDVFRNSPDHPSAEEVYGVLKREYPTLSLGTVYRNISLFREAGEIVPVCTVNGHERYDANITEHAHFVCEICGSVIDITAAFDNMKISDEYGIVKRRVLTCYGECRKCAESRVFPEDK